MGQQPTGYTGTVNTTQKLTRGLRGQTEHKHDQGEDCCKAAELVTNPPLGQPLLGTGNKTQGSGCFVCLLADTGFNAIPMYILI